ncbi:hypothetical protein JW766_03170 [Candidatus Dojkabacteria bacterium]|nr:hypothetical protein [Candidatus Dojkabacteria bacterium]
MDDQNTATPLTDEANTGIQGSVEATAQTAELSVKTRKIKPIYIILALVILLLICGGAAGGIYLFIRQAQDKEEQEQQDQKAGEEKTGEQEDAEEDETEEESEVEMNEEENIENLYEGWTKIDNDECQISFYYPSEWYADDDKNGDFCTRISTLKNIPATESGNLPLLITIGVFVSEYNTPEEYYEYLKQYPSVNVITSTREVDGEDRYFVEYTDEYNYTFYNIYYEVNGVYYVISWCGTEVDDYHEEIDKFIDSISMN